MQPEVMAVDTTSRFSMNETNNIQSYPHSHLNVTQESTIEDESMRDEDDDTSSHDSTNEEYHPKTSQHRQRSPTQNSNEENPPKRPHRGKCLYQSRKCENERALKRNGRAHNLCEEHRSKQNQHQRKFDAKKFSRKHRHDSPSNSSSPHLHGRYHPTTASFLGFGHSAPPYATESDHEYAQRLQSYDHRMGYADHQMHHEKPYYPSQYPSEAHLQSMKHENPPFSGPHINVPPLTSLSTRVSSSPTQHYSIPHQHGAIQSPNYTTNPTSNFAYPQSNLPAARSFAPLPGTQTVNLQRSEGYTAPSRALPGSSYHGPAATYPSTTNPHSNPHSLHSMSGKSGPPSYFSRPPIKLPSISTTTSTVHHGYTRPLTQPTSGPIQRRVISSSFTGRLIRTSNSGMPSNFGMPPHVNMTSAPNNQIAPLSNRPVLPSLPLPPRFEH